MANAQGDSFNCTSAYMTGDPVSVLSKLPRGGLIHPDKQVYVNVTSTSPVALPSSPSISKSRTLYEWNIWNILVFFQIE